MERGGVESMRMAGRAHRCKQGRAGPGVPSSALVDYHAPRFHGIGPVFGFPRLELAVIIAFGFDHPANVRIVVERMQ